MNRSNRYTFQKLGTTIGNRNRETRSMVIYTETEIDHLTTGKKPATTIIGATTTTKQQDEGDYSTKGKKQTNKSTTVMHYSNSGSKILNSKRRSSFR